MQVKREAAAQQAQVLLAFDDPASREVHPGWPLRNLLLLASVRWGLQEVGVVCVRCLKGPVSAQRCLYVHARLPPLPPGMTPPLPCNCKQNAHAVPALLG